MEHSRKNTVRGELETKAFILFVLGHFDDAVLPETLISLTMDYVSDRLEYAASLEDMISRGLVERRGERLAITQRGRATSEQVESVIPAATRAYASQDARVERAALEKDGFIKSEITKLDGSGYLGKFSLDGGDGLSLKIELVLPSRANAEAAEKGWRKHAESVYRDLITRLIEDGDEEARMQFEA